MSYIILFLSVSFSLFLRLSVSPNVILTNAGIHRTASVVAGYFRFIASVVIGFALCGCLSVAVSAFPNTASGVCG
ncbi:hypothetical protein [Vibrio vulnificus]|uniref:hypothetical protein n=1 Tax=Vibrio vulnificus TaxID=672 RepID=UPI001029A6F4|nr:hypothetical protein [Vibrio vulnificus]